MMPLRIAVCQVQEVDDSIANYARQLGVTSINITTAALPAERGFWTTDDLADLRKRCADRGLVLEVIENLPFGAYERIILGAPGRDEQLENYCRTIRNMAAAEIPMLGFHFMPNGVWRTDMHAPSRGGSTASAYDHSLAHLGNKVGMPADVIEPSVEAGVTELSAEEVWANYEYFLDAVLPVADEVGLKLAQHPDDPPVESIDGFARVFNSPAAYKRAHELAKGSPAWGINLCIGTISEMYGAESVHEMIEHFGPLGRIRYVHFRDVKGTVPSFVETWLGEGNYVPHKVIEHLLAVGFDGWLQDDHVPFMTEDTPYGHRARAHEIGYLQGILSTLQD
jgi:mannonate dehydratase